MQVLTTPEALQSIQAILAPALLISACGLLLLGLNNRYTTVVSRIRTLNDEKRRRLADPVAIDREYIDALRFESVMRQIPSMFVRASRLRYALICLWIGIVCYLLTSLCLGVSVLLSVNLAIAAVWIFMIGILSASAGVVFALLDIALAHKVLKLEIDIY